MRRLLLLVFLAVGCTSQNLGGEWRPLERITASKILSPSKTGARTIGSTVYVYDLKTWLAQHPEPLLTAVLKHEQVHAHRQLNYPDGETRWIQRYLTDPAFAWEEEQVGWYEQITYARAHGVVFIPEGLAKALSDYRTLAGPMVSYDEALAWVRAVISGHWHPGR